MKKSELEAVIAQMAQQIAAINASLRDTAPVATAPVQTVETVAAEIQTSVPVKADKVKNGGKWTDEQKADTMAVGTIEGVISRVASHGLGLQFEGDAKTWHNVRKDGKPIFASLKKGQSVRLSLNVAGRVTGMVLDPKTSTTSTKKNGKAAVTAASLPTSAAPQVTTLDAADTVRTTKNGELKPDCTYCKGPAHHNYSCKQVTDECILRQYVAKTGNSEPDLSAPDTFVAYATWLAASYPLMVFAHNVAGFKVIGAPTTTTVSTATAPTTTPPPVVEDIDAKLENTKDKKRQRRAANTTPAAAVKAADAAPEPTVSTTTDGPVKKSADLINGQVYVGYVSKHGSTPGLFRFVGANVTGYDGNGVWVQAKPSLVPAITKLVRNDKLKIVLADMTIDGKTVTRIDKAMLLDTAAAVSGKVKGVQTSGKQDAPAPKAEPRDEAVDKAKKARRDARKAAQNKRDAAVVAGEAISA